MITIQQLLEAKAGILDAVTLIEQGIIQFIGENHQLTVDKKALLAALSSATPDFPSPPHLLYKLAGENEGWGDAIYYNKGESLSVLKDEVVVCGGRSGIINDKGHPIEIDWDNVTFVQGKFASYWGTNMNGVTGRMENCTFSRIGDKTLTSSTGVKDGHPIYFKPGQGSVEFIGNRFLENEGNVQFANRPWENEVPSSTDLFFENNVFVSNAWDSPGHGGGGASTLAIYCATDEGTNVEVTNNVFHSAIPYPGKYEAQSKPSARGAVTIWNEAYYPSQSIIDKGFDPDPSKKFGNVLITGNTIRTEVADRALIQVQGAEEIVIEANELILPEEPMAYPVIRIDHDLTNPQKAKRISIKPIDAPGEIQIGKERFPLSKGYEYQEAGSGPFQL